MYHSLSCRKNNRGFTIIDVIVSLALLGLVFIPLMGYFSSSVRANVHTKKAQKASFAAQTVVEELNACSSLQEIAKQFNDPARSGWGELDYIAGSYSDTSNPSYSIVGGTGEFQEKMVYYYKRPIEIDGNTYNARITVDTQPYTAAVNEMPMNQTVIAYNTLDIPVVQSLNGDGVCLAVEGIQEDTMVYSLMSYYSAYKTEQLLLGFNLPDIDEADIRNDLTRTIQISISPQDAEGDVRVKVYYTYQCPSINGLNTPVESDALFNEKVKRSKLSDIYLFFKKLKDNDDVTISDATMSGTGKYNLHLICQEESGVVPSVTAVISEVATIGNLGAVYSNIPVTLNSPGVNLESLISYTNKQRLADITVEIYDVDDMSKPIIEIRTTRGE